MRRSVLITVATTTVAAAAVVGVAFAGLDTSAGASTQRPSHPAARHLRYVAMGDSYSAASGNTPNPSAPPECAQSSINYPHLIAAKIHADLRDVTCGGAEDKDYFHSQYQGVEPQLDALRKNTQLVTMTIGGNDSGVFLDSILECGSAGIAAGGKGAPCKAKYGDSFDKTIRTTTYPAIVRSLRAVHRRAPHARVAILSYPWILPKTTGCFPSMPIAKGDVPYLRKEQSVLNNAVRRAAKATHSIFVDLDGASNGHDACKPMGVRWIEPVLGGTNPVIVHPNPLGERRMAHYTEKKLHLR